MEVGLGQDGRFDCSGLVIVGLLQATRLSKWPRTLRHTRQMVDMLDASGAQPKPYSEVIEYTDAHIGDLAFSHRWYDGQWRIGHVSIVTEHGALQSQNGCEGVVIERPLRDLPSGSPDRLVYSAASLARLAFELAEQSLPGPATLARV